MLLSAPPVIKKDDKATKSSSPTMTRAKPDKKRTDDIEDACSPLDTEEDFLGITL